MSSFFFFDLVFLVFPLPVSILILEIQILILNIYTRSSFGQEHFLVYSTKPRSISFFLHKTSLIFSRGALPIKALPPVSLCLSFFLPFPAFLLLQQTEIA